MPLTKMTASVRPYRSGAVSVKFDLAPEYELAQMLFRSLAECLGFLRRVNPVQPYAEQLVASHERFYGVAVGYADDSS
jgi:hypothetical protein